MKSCRLRVGMQRSVRIAFLDIARIALWGFRVPGAFWHNLYMVFTWPGERCHRLAWWCSHLNRRTVAQRECALVWFMVMR